MSRGSSLAIVVAPRARVRPRVATRAPLASRSRRASAPRGVGPSGSGASFPGDGASPPPRLEASAGPTRAEDLDAVVEDVDDARDAFGPGSHPYESFSARGDPAPAADAFSADGASAGPLGVPAGSPSGAPVAYVPGAPSTSAPSPPAAPMSALTSALFNVGFFSTAILVVVGVRRAARFWNGIPDLSEEERLRRMADFASAQTERVRDMPPSVTRDAELKRLERLSADIAGKRTKFEAAERRRAEWNRRVRRVAVDIPDPRSPARGGDDPDDPHVPGFSEERARRLEREAASARMAAEAAEAKAAPPGAGARWVTADEYLRRAMDDDADDPSARRGGGEGGGERSDVPGDSVPGDSASSPPPRETVEGVPIPEQPEFPSRSSRRPAPREDPVPRKKKKKRASPKKLSRGGSGSVTRPDAPLTDARDDLTDLPHLTPEQELELAAEIQRLEQLYGDDRSVSAERLDELCQDLIDKYGLGEKTFTDREKYDPRLDPEARDAHPSAVNPYYWRELKAVHVIFEASPATRTTSVMTMMMTHPGLPAYLPGGKRPEPRDHAVAFESRADAERFVWLMRSAEMANGPEPGRPGPGGSGSTPTGGICTTRPMPPKLLEETSEEGGLGVTVVAEGRVRLDPGRRDVDVLAEIREIGGEQYLYDFARFTNEELEEGRKPPPPTLEFY